MSSDAYGQAGGNVDVNPPYPEANVDGVRSSRLGGIWDEMAGAGGPQIVMKEVHIHNDMDVHTVAYQVAMELERWRRR